MNFWLKKVLGAVLLGGWLFAVTHGFNTLANHTYTPGINAIAAQSWPRDTKLRLASDQPTLLIFGHPKCPCTRASFGELDILLAKIDGKAKTYALFMQPAGWTSRDMQTDLVRNTSLIPQVEVVKDVEGEEARRFGVKVSGHVVVFEPSGRLIFSGGITGGRGHAGDNAGRTAIVGYFQTGIMKAPKTSVFGCSLFNDEALVAKQTIGADL